MLRIKFYYFDKQITWTIDNLYISLVAYLLGLSLGFVFVQIIKKIKSKNYKKTIRGGGSDAIKEIDQCIDSIGEDRPYIVKDSNLIDIIKTILNLKSNSKPTLIDKGIFLLGVILHKQFSIVAQIMGTNLAGVIQSFGFEIVVSNMIAMATNIGVSLGVGVSTALITFLLKFTFFQIITTSAATLLIVIWLTLNIFPFDCSKFVDKIPQKQVDATERVLHFVELPNLYDDGMFLLKTNEDQEIYYRHTVRQDCKLTEVDKNEFIFGDISGEELTHPDEDFTEVCTNVKSTYIKSKEKTKTLEDIRNIKKPEITDKVEEINKVIKTESNNNKSLKPKSKVKEMNEKYGPIGKRTQTIEGLDKEKINPSSQEVKNVSSQEVTNVSSQENMKKESVGKVKNE